MAFLDWLQYTIKEEYDKDHRFDCIQSFLSSLPRKVYDYICREVYAHELSTIHMMCRDIDGVNFYGAGFDICGVNVFYAAPDINKTFEMGYNVVVSGSVLAAADVSAEDVRDWIANILPDFDWQLSRIDIAIDTDTDFAYWLDKYNCREFLSKAREYSVHLDKNNRGTIYIGKRSARCMVRIYDKKQEQLSKLKGQEKRDFKAKMQGKQWTRFELQVRHDACLAAIAALIDGTVNTYFIGYLRFVETFDGVRNKSRAKTDENYANVLNCEMGRTFMKIENDQFNSYYFMTIVLPQAKALATKNPAMYNEMWDNADVSASTMRKLENDELAQRRAQRRLELEREMKEREKHIGEQVRIPDL